MQRFDMGDMMKPNRLALGIGAVATSFLLAHPAFAQGAVTAVATSPIPKPTVDKGDTAWMLVSSLLVLMMSVPGLALFYGGLVRTKNMLSVLTQVLMIVCMVAVIWVTFGYSEAFTGGNAFFGGMSKAFLMGVDANSQAASFSNGVYIPEYAYICFQMTFACITPALFVGSIAERVKFSPLMLFVALWVVLVYFPIAHMVWYWEGPDAVAAAALKGTAALAAANADAGWLFQKGALDFAGGTVVHINAGITGLVMCIMLGKRTGFPKEPMPPHSLTMTMIGASLLWVGWVRVQRRVQPGIERGDRGRVHQHLRRHRRGGAVLGAGRAGRSRQAVAAGGGIGGRRRAGRGHAGIGLCGADGIGRAGPDGLADLLLLRGQGEVVFRL